MSTVTTFARLAVPTALAALCAVGVSAPAQATQPTGVTAETLAELELNPILLPPPPPGHPPVADEVEGTLRRIVIAPGGSTGWHHHGGHVQGLVAAGTLTRVLADCTRSVTPAGSWVTEDPGGDHVGLNLGTEPVVLLVTYVMPDDEPFSRDAPARCE
ncbi:cupin domain-containing protein [Rhodococcus sp. NPDC058514]|uniref:cupin domain-containing protein n=1 Tax=unclassified Rhodococcus (in: high G+C Gram-positive bacteria) TaxID=192944 RepID=UPI00365D4EA1